MNKKIRSILIEDERVILSLKSGFNSWDNHYGRIYTNDKGELTLSSEDYIHLSMLMKYKEDVFKKWNEIN